MRHFDPQTGWVLQELGNHDHPDTGAHTRQLRGIQASQELLKVTLGVSNPGPPRTAFRGGVSGAVNPLSSIEGRGVSAMVGSRISDLQTFPLELKTLSWRKSDTGS